MILPYNPAQNQSYSLGALTQILAKNLPEAARTRLGGVSQVYLDTPADFSIPMSKDVEKLSDLNKIKVEGGLRSSIDFTDTNNAVLVEYLTPLTTDRRSKWIDVVIFVEGIPTSFTRLYVVAKNSDTRTWEVEPALPADHWIELSSNKFINTIDYGGYTFTKPNVLTSWDYPTYGGDFTPTQDGSGWNPAYGMWPVDYGDWVDRKIPDQNTIKPVKMVAVEDIRPHVNFVYLLKRGFCEIGWTLGGLLLETEWALSLWAYLLREQYYTGKGYDGVPYGKYCRIIGRTIIDDILIAFTPTQQNLYFTVLDFVGFSGAELPFQADPNKWACGIKNPLPFKARFKISFKFTIEAAGLIVVDQTFLFNMQELEPADTDNDTFTGEILSDDAQFVLGVGETKFVAFDFDVELEPSQKCALHWDATAGAFAAIIKAGMWMRIEPANEALTREDEIDLRTCLSEEWTLLDSLKAFSHITNGRIETDYGSKVINIHPERAADVYADRVPGFIREDIPAEDIAPFVLPNSVKMRFVRPDIKRYTVLKFADSTDEYIDSLPLTDPLHSRKILNGEDLLDETEEIENLMFEPTAEGQSDLLKQNEFAVVNRPNAPVPYLPRYWDNTDGSRSFGIGPRILFAFGMVKQVNPAPLGTTDLYANFFFDEYASATEAFGYATQLRTWSLDPAPTLDGNVVFGRTASDLFVNFYIGLTQDNRGGVEIDLLQQMTMAQYQRYNFRGLFSFQYEGRHLRVPQTSIRDFTPNIPTPVQYFASPVESECCDLPCSCRFTECDYYQDLGEFIQQSTMDDLNISSFKIDDVEQLANPVYLGQLNIIDLGGGPYVTNLVDALNSIGAPYFSFSYHTRSHATRGIRFFKIKWPACQGFEIIVSNVGAEVYRYRHDSQNEQWFAGSWGPIGYAPATFTAPDNCVTTIEY